MNQKWIGEITSTGGSYSVTKYEELLKRNESFKSKLYDFETGLGKSIIYQMKR